MRAEQLRFLDGTKARAEQGGRGMALEKALESQHEAYLWRKIARIDHQHVPAVPVGDGKWAKVIGKSTVDYVGNAGGRFVAFDAKEEQEGRIPLARLMEHQLEYLLDVERTGGIAFVLVRFFGERCYCIPAAAWRMAEEAARAGHALPAKWRGLDVPATGRKSIREDALPEEWRVCGVDWLRVVDSWESRT